MSKAMKFTQKALDLDKENRIAMSNLGLIHLETKDYISAKIILGYAIENDPRNINNYLNSFYNNKYSSKQSIFKFF